MSEAYRIPECMNNCISNLLLQANAFSCSRQKIIEGLERKKEKKEEKEMEATMDWRPMDNGHAVLANAFRENRADGHIHVEEAEPAEEEGGEERVNGVEEEPEVREEQPTAYVDCFADWRVLSQTVVISDVKMASRSFSLYTQLAMLPLDANLTTITLNIGRNCKLPNEVEGSVGVVSVNDVRAVYQRIDPFEGMARACREKSMSELTRVRGERLREYAGELRIQIPQSELQHVRRLACIKVTLEVVVKNAVDGVQFNATVGADGNVERGAHAFTFRSSLMSSTSEWLPCIDSPDQLSLWTIHFTVDASMMVIAAAELTDVEISRDLREKTFHYQQLVPTAPTNMGWAIGEFEGHVHADMPELTNFSLPGTSSLVTHTVASLDRTFEYFEELLSCRFPFPSYKQAFVDNLPEDIVCYSSFSLISVNVLYHKKMIDVVQPTRTLLAFAIAQQFFGCFISAAEFADLWVVRSLARFLASLFIEKVFGTCELLFHTKQLVDELCEYENTWGMVVLRQTKCSPFPLSHADSSSSLTCSPLYAEQLFKKGELVIRLLSKRLGHEPFFQVLHKLLTVGEQMGGGRREQPTCWTYLVLSTHAFFRTVHTVTGQEIPTFLEQLVYGGGHASFNINFAFNRKRNMVELDIRQEETMKSGIMSYTGPLTISVQELDGCFQHVVQIDSDLSRHELQCHSKGRRQKRKKVPLSTGEEVEVDLSNMDPDSPVLWIRVDPHLLLLRELHVRQPSYQWEYLLSYERDSLAQMNALAKIEQFPSASSRAILLDTINNEHFYYRVRCRAAFALTSVHNKMAEVVMGPPALLTLFADKFGCKSASHIPRSNNFLATSSNLQTYFLMQSIPQAVGRMRSKYNAALQEAHSFLLDLIYYNDNSTNRYSDDFYRASLLIALTCTVLTGETLGDSTNPSSMTTENAQTLREFTLALNMDTLRPSYGRVVGVAALLGIYQMQKTGIIPADSSVFWKFAQPNVFVEMRKTALYILVDRQQNVRGQASVEELLRLIRTALDDPHPGIRRYVPELLARHPPFEYTHCGEMGSLNTLNMPHVAEQIWAIITAPRTECRVRSTLCDVWFSMFGWSVPPSLGGSVDRTTLPDTRDPPLRTKNEGRLPSPVRGWHSTDVNVEKDDTHVVAFDEALNEETLQ